MIPLIMRKREPMITYDKKSDSIIRNNRKVIYAKMKDLVLNIENLEQLYRLYDDLFFNNQLQNQLAKKLSFSLSARMTKTAGKTMRIRQKNDIAYEIRFSSVIAKDIIASNNKSVAGVCVSNQLEAFMIVMEHELCHVIEWYNRNTTNCKQKYFKQMANDIFGHTSSYHELTKETNERAHATKVNVGDEINFQYKGKSHIGTVVNINKRATVMVKNIFGRYKDTEKKRYDKYYVPLAHINKNTEKI